MRPVSTKFPVNQQFGSYATAGVRANEFGTEVEQLVFQYGNYQPFGHAGQDIACPVGTPVRAIADGTVLWADWGTNLPGDESDSGYRRRWYLYKTFPGIVTVIQHDGWISVYAHLSDAPLNPGDRVTEGQEIARSGNTRSPGVSLGAHLHVEALVDMTYSTGNRLIYGRTDPEFYYGAVASMGSKITPLSEEDDMFSDSDRQNLEKTVTQQATIIAMLDNIAGWMNGDGTELRDNVRKLIYALASLPAGVLNQPFALADGTKTNLAGILAAINAKPGSATGPGAAADPQAVANAVVSTLSKQLGK